MPNMRSRRPASACRCRTGFDMVEAAALARDAVHRLAQSVRARPCARRRDRAGPWRHQRHRHDGDRARAVCSASRSSSPAAATRNAARPRRSARSGRSTIATQDFVAEVQALTDGRGVAVVLDMVGGDYLPRNLQCLAEDGRHVSIAVQSGVKAEINIAQIMRRRLTLTGSTLRPRSVGFKTLLADEIEREVWPFVAEGQAEAGDRPRLSAGRGGRGAPPDGGGRACRQDHAEGALTGPARTKAPANRRRRRSAPVARSRRSTPPNRNIRR